MAEVKYRTVTGIVKFPPRDAEVERDGETITVRNVLVRQTGITKNEAQDVRATLWPSHAHVELDEGDAVLLEGKFTTNPGKDADDNPITYLNLSVSGIVKLGVVDTGERDDQPRAKKSADTDSDDEPW